MTPDSPATDRCPVAGCQAVLGPEHEAAQHLHRHAARDGWEFLVVALLHLQQRLAWLTRLDTAANEASAFSLSRALLDALGDGRVMTLAELSKAAGERAPVVRTALRRLIRRGLVEQPRKGKYRSLVGDSPGASHG